MAHSWLSASCCVHSTGWCLFLAEYTCGLHMASNESHSHHRGAHSMDGGTKLPRDSTQAQQRQLQQVSSSESVEPTAGRQQLLTARQLLLSRDRAGAQRAYTLALHQGQSSQQFDLAACFLCHLRLAQLSFSLADGGRGANRSSNNSSGEHSAHGDYSLRFPYGILVENHLVLCSRPIVLLCPDLSAPVHT